MTETEQTDFMSAWFGAIGQLDKWPAIPRNSKARATLAKIRNTFGLMECESWKWKRFVMLDPTMDNHPVGSGYSVVRLHEP